MKKGRVIEMSFKRPLGRRIQARVFKVVNVPMRVVLGLPFPTPLGRRLMLVHTVGRKTSKHYRQPVSYVRAEDVLLTPGGGRWTRNLGDGEPVRIRVRGRDRTVAPELVDDPDEVHRLLAVMSKANPALRRFVRIPSDAAGHFDRAALDAAIRHGFLVVRWHHDDRSAGDTSARVA
jgi:deazaflavin-dependent oxidoreductase (nitroreductase family)